MTQRKYFASTWSGNIRVLVWKDGENGLLTPKDAGWLLIAQKLKSRRAVSLQEIVIFSKVSYVKL